MNIFDFKPENKKALIEFYKAIKVASKLIPGRHHATTKVVQLADEIITELKKENPDQSRVEMLSNNLQQLANPQSWSSTKS